MLVDRYGRVIDYMRISVTDRCNLRCRYCMPEEGTELFERKHILSYEQLEKLVDLAITAGIKKFRFTGGEPLVRRDLVPFIGRVAAKPGVDSVGITTNGLLLEKFADDLFAAGVRRINLSLDSLDRETFRKLTHRDALEDVLRGLERVTELGFAPIKINAVLMRGINTDEIDDLLALTDRHAYHLRFIEFMPYGEWQDRQSYVVAADEIHAILESKGYARDAGPSGMGPAYYFRRPGAPGSVGIISPVSDKFCEGCNRLRLNAQGELRSCLLDSSMVNLKDAVDAEADDEVKRLFIHAVQTKPEKHYDLRDFHMVKVGG